VATAPEPAPVARPPEGVEVRAGQPRDAASFAELWRTVVAEGRWVRSDQASGSVRYYRRRFFRRTWTEDRASIVAVHRARVVGHLEVSREESPATRHVASLGMAVAPDWRGRGVGTALLAQAIRWARQVGVEKLALSVYPHNEAALHLYRKFGFREEGRLTGHSKKAIGYVDEIVMGLWLVERDGPGGAGPAPASRARAEVTSWPVRGGA
jgi:ribosomal protein S18 acetylase RimI-like enzyme